MSDIIALVLPFFGMIFLGSLVAWLTKQPLEALGWMNTFILYVALPALFFQLVSKTPFEQLTNWRFILGAVAATYLVFALMFLISLAFSRNVGESTIRALASCYGNIGYMGPGLALLAFGEQAAVPVALIICIENAAHFAVTPLLMGMAGEKRQSAARIAAEIAKKIGLNPFFLATVLGVLAAWLQLQVPVAADTMLDYLARAAAPCALFAMGVTIALRPLKRLPLDILPVTLLKLIVHPLLCYLILTSIGDLPSVWIYTAVLMAALPTATNVFVMAQQYGFWVQRASASVLITTAVSIVTLTTILYIIKSGLLPADPWS